MGQLHTRPPAFAFVTKDQSLYLLIGLGILVVASFVVAYYSSKTWHWSQVLLVEAVFLSAVGYLFLAVEVLGIHAILRTQINQTATRLADTEELRTALADGTKDRQLIRKLQAQDVEIPDDAEQVTSVRDLDHQLHLLTRIRGRVWREAVPAGVDPQTGVARATLPNADTSGIDTNTIVFLFEEGEPNAADPTQGKQYLGEFRVSGVDGQQLTLSPVLEMDQFETDRLADSTGPWALYETMPVDRQEIFAGMSEEELRRLLPAATVDEYIRSGQEPRADDPPSRLVGYDEEGNRLGPEDMEKDPDRAVRIVYERRQRDYALEFGELSRQRIVMMADGAAVRQDNERLKAALESAERLQTFREDELKRLNVDLAGITRDRQVVERQLAYVTRQRDVARQRLAQLLRQNAQLADMLAARQTALADEIDARTSDAQPSAPLPAGAAL